MRSTAIELVDRRACPVCGTPTEQIVLDLAYEVPPISDYLERFYGGALDPVRLRGERYRLASCASCTLTYQVGVPDEAFLAELYDEVLAADPEEVRSGRGLAVRQGYAHQVEQFLVHFGRPPDEVQVLDFGAGQSPWLDMAAAWGCATTAIELSAAKATTASDAGHEVVTLGEAITGLAIAEAAMASIESGEAVTAAG